MTIFCSIVILMLTVASINFFRLKEIENGLIFLIVTLPYIFVLIQIK